MKGYQLKNFILIALILGVFFIVLSYISLVASISIYAGTEKTTGMIKKQGVSASYVQFGKVYIKLFSYYAKYNERLDERTKKKLQQSLFYPPSVTLIVLSLLLFIVRAPLTDFRPFTPPEKLHGDAKWATERDIVKSGLRKKSGVIMGTTGRGFLIADGFQHILLFAPTGSGKGVGFVIPNLLFWTESLICHDIKLENYELTSGYRQKMGQKVYLWNAASPKGITHCYNPLDWVAKELGQMVDDVQKIANLLLPEQEFWNNEARSLFVGVALYLLSVPEKITSFGEVIRTLKSDDVVYNLAVVLDTLGKQIHPVAYMNIAAFLQKADKERSGVTSTLNSGLELWSNPLIDAATATSDFDFNTFKKVPVSVFVGLTPDNIDRLKPLMQIFYQQAAQIMTKHTPKPDEKFGVLMLMDEFPTLGEMFIFKQGIAYFRGYKVRLFLIIQDIEQLKDIYEEAGMNSFLANATYRITFAANTFSTAEMISQMIGNKTVKQISRNAPVFVDLNPASRSKHLSETQRALLLPQEVINLPKDQQIILVESSPPIKSRKIFYYKDSFFTKRLLPQTPVPQQEPYDPKTVGKKKVAKTEEKPAEKKEEKDDDGDE
jgi:type IV secretion system protein VirD4